MPYKSQKDLPEAVKSLPSGAKSIFMAAFNAAYKQNDGDEEAAFRIAWSAVKRKFKKEGDKWVAKDTATQDSTEIEMRERISFDDAAQVRRTSDGYLVASPRVARTGIQVYRGWEVGDWEHPNRQVRVYRSEDEVFHEDAVASLAHRPITLRHPGERVTAANWKKYSIGQAGDEVLRDGHFVRIPMTLMDKDAIDSYEKGVRELSVGYRCELKWGEGKTPEGETYDAAQTGIRGNHIALCDTARGGRDLRFGDEDRSDEDNDDGKRRSKRGVRTMDTDDLEMFDVNGVKTPMPATAAALVAREFKSFNDQITALKTSTTDLQTQLAAAKTLVEKRDGEIVVLQKQLKDAELTPEKLDGLAGARARLYADAVAVLGDKFDFRDKTDAQIRRAIAEAGLGADVAKAMSDGAIEGAVTAIVALARKNGTGNGNQGAGPAFTFGANTNDALQHALHRPGGPANGAAKAYDDRSAQLRDAWKTPAPK